MTFEDVQRDLYGRWQKRLLYISWISAVVVFLSEIGILISFIKSETLLDNIIHYVIIRVVIPFTLNFGLVIANTIVYFCTDSRSKQDLRNHSAVMAVFGICAVLSIFHNYYFFLLVATAMPQMLCTVFADRKIITRIASCSLVVFIISCVVFWNDRVWFIDDVYKVTTIFSCAVFLIFNFTVALSVVRTQSVQIMFIYNNYQRQTELIEELKIEPLTHLYNRAAFNDCIENLVINAQNGKASPYVAMMDIDFFKKVNDSYGHANGDTVLVNLSWVIRENLGSVRQAFRYGGEEFIVVFDNEELDEVYDTVKRIKDSFERLSYPFSGGLHFTLSAGIAAYKKGMTAREWIDEADIAMYRSKKAGRNKITVAE